MHIASIGIDIGKTTFHVVALNEHGSVVVRRKFSRKQLVAYTANVPASLIGMEACGGAHCLARVIGGQGHQVRLIPGQFVKPFRKSNKNDYLDAEAIAEAVTRHNMRFVPIKTEDQLDLQGLHRVRERLVHNRAERRNLLEPLAHKPKLGAGELATVITAYTWAMEDKKPVNPFEDVHKKAQAAIDHARDVREARMAELEKKKTEPRLIADGNLQRCSVCGYPFPADVHPSMSVVFAEHLLKAHQPGGSGSG